MNELDVIVESITTEDDFQILDIFMGRGRIQPEVLRSLHLPGHIDFSKGIIVCGRAPIWLHAYLIHLYKEAPWIATFNPMTGAVVVASNSAEGPQVGHVVPSEKVIPYLPQHLEAPKPDESQRGTHSKAMAFLGPPHRGKSVLMNAIRLKMEEHLNPQYFQRYFYVLRACPDGEGDWYSEIPKETALTLRYKNRFDDAFVNDICNALDHLRRQKRLLLVDCGGRIDKKNQHILNLCTHAIIVSCDREQIPIWRGAALSSELEILGEVESTPYSCAQVICASPLRVRLGKLERGNERHISLPDIFLNLLLEEVRCDLLHNCVEGETGG